SGAMLIDAILNRPVPQPRKLNPEISPPLEAVILKAVNKDPKSRYQSAREMLAELEALDSLSRVRFTSRALEISIVALLTLLHTFSIGLEHRRITALVQHFLNPVPANKYVAVMPFRSVANDDPAFEQGLAEALAARLMEITAAQAVQVVSPRELRAEHVEDVADARKKLGVNLAVAGTLQRLQGATRVTLELVDAGTRRLLRAANFTASTSDPFSLQDQIIERTVEMLEIEIHSNVSSKDHGTTNQEAF